MDYFISAFIGLIFGLLLGIILTYDAAAISTTKGEYICQYNEFADDWDCKREVKDEQK